MDARALPYTHAHAHALGTPPAAPGPPLVEEVGPGAGRGRSRRPEEVGVRCRTSPPAGPAMEAEPPLYPVAGAVGAQGDEDQLGVPDGPEAPVSGDGEGVAARGPEGPGSPPRERDAAPGPGGVPGAAGDGRGAPGVQWPGSSAVVPRSWTSWWARTRTTTSRRRSAATTAASGSACSRTCWRPARAACSPTASTWVGGPPRPAGWRVGPLATPFRPGPGEVARPGGFCAGTQVFPLPPARPPQT